MRPATCDIGASSGRPPRAGHRFIGDAHGARLDEILGLLRIGRQMQIGVEDLALAQHLALGCLRLLHLHDHVGLGEDFLRGLDDRGAGLLVVFIGGADAAAGIRLDQDLVAVAHGLADAKGRHADAVFVILDFLRNADEHCRSSVASAPGYRSRTRMNFQRLAFEQRPC